MWPKATMRAPGQIALHRRVGAREEVGRLRNRHADIVVDLRAFGPVAGRDQLRGCAQKSLAWLAFSAISTVSAPRRSPCALPSVCSTRRAGPRRAAASNSISTMSAAPGIGSRVSGTFLTTRSTREPVHHLEGRDRAGRRPSPDAARSSAASAAPATPANADLARARPGEELEARGGHDAQACPRRR